MKDKFNGILFFVGLFVLMVLGTSCSSTHGTAEPKMLQLEGDLRVHDPVVIKDGDTNYLFCTGGRRRTGYVPIRCSQDLHTWELCGHVFEALPVSVLYSIEVVSMNKLAENLLFDIFGNFDLVYGIMFKSEGQGIPEELS